MDAATDTHRIAVAPGVHLAVKVSGTPGKPALVFSNSLAADMSSWDAVADRLAPHARIVRYDTRGHGASDAPQGPYDIAMLGGDALAVMDALGITRAVFCGLSLGGLTGMWLGAHAGDRLAGLVLANTAANFPPAQMWLDRAEGARRDGLAALVEPTLARWFTAAYRAAQPARVAKVGAAIAATPVEGYAASCGLLGATDLLPSLGEISCPTLVIAGAHDPSTPPARAAEIAAAVPGAELVTLDAAHLSAVEAGDAFAEALTAFLSRLKLA
ncbi:3-oxoadipate enol-lactonase [Aquabacter spiritensis]|uniref:3-oxoadipate enol-lactonase n=1 Tax=Aquabacter spiritensis TaxID=933073 RepID=A0A4R3M0I4_9HYPH|nr:3-oxoadipate enol-lactonase [Aquabacter spiritensis]TCT06086.1 3-oxoadipate enol-lactonase [Aquabacter spiritensis]